MGKTLLSVLQQLRAGYRSRPESFPHALALIGLRDVRDYKVRELPGVSDPVIRELKEILGTSSPFNIKVRSLTLRNFTEEEVGELYGQHTQETGQAFTAEAVQLAYGLTRGQPWLVNALADQVVTEEAPDPATIGSITRRIVLEGGSLDFDRLLEDFVGFWREHAESFLKLQRIVNGGGYIDREYAVGSGRVDRASTSSASASRRGRLSSSTSGRTRRRLPNAARVSRRSWTAGGFSSYSCEPSGRICTLCEVQPPALP